MSTALIGLGSNLGNRERFLRGAINAMEELPESNLVLVSSLHESPAAGAVSDPDFLNAAVRLDTNLSPRTLLWHLLRIESRLGRERGRRFGPRSIDLDLLFFDDSVISEADLTVPHPRALERSFVLIPLAEIAPEFRDPVTGQSLGELGRNCRRPVGRAS